MLNSYRKESQKPRKTQGENSLTKFVKEVIVSDIVVTSVHRALDTKNIFFQCMIIPSVDSFKLIETTAVCDYSVL